MILHCNTSAFIECTFLILEFKGGMLIMMLLVGMQLLVVLLMQL